MFWEQVYSVEQGNSLALGEPVLEEEGECTGSSGLVSTGELELNEVTTVIEYLECSINISSPRNLERRK